MLRGTVLFSRLSLALAALGLIVVGVALPGSRPAQASAAGINQSINFQGRLLNAAGAVVADGTYNMRFKIYQDGDGTAVGDTGGSPIGAVKWQELWQMSVASGSSSGVVVKNGYFSVNLGTYCGLTTNGSCQGTSNLGVNFNWDTLWLSMDVGGTTVTNTPTYDGEMLPMKRMSSAVYALQAASANTCTGCILQAPAGTAQNTINPGSGNAVGLTIQASTNGANPDLLGLNNSGGTAVAKIDRTGNIFTPSIDAFGTTLTLGGANATGTISVGTAASGINIGHSGITTTSLGALAVSEALTANGNTTIGNATTDRLTVTSQVLGQDALVFQGATDDSFTTTLRITDPTTPSKIITLPNETGTICTTGSVCTGYAPATGGSYAKQDLSNLASVAINAPLSFVSTGSGSIGFNSAASAGGNTLAINGQTAGGSANGGGAITVQAGTATTTGAGGDLTLQGGTSPSGAGGNVFINPGTGSPNGSISLGTLTSGTTINLASSATATGKTDTVNIATGNTVGTGAKIVHIADGTPGGTGVNTVTIGSLTNASATTFQGGTASNAILLQTASAGGITMAPGTGGITATLGNASQFAVNATPTADTSQNSFKITLNPTITGSTATLQGLLISQSDNANTGVYDSLAKIENLKTPETTTNGLFIEQNAASGTLTNGLQVTNTTGNITNAINLTGTFTNLLNSPTIDINNAGAISGATGLVSSGTIQLSGLTTDGPVYTSGGNGTLNSEANLSVARGGSGAGTFSANAVLLGNGTGAFQVVAPGLSGNILTSNGTTWTSAAPAAGCATCIAQVPTTTAQNTINPGVANVIGLTIRGGSSGSPRILEIRDSGNTVQGYFDSVGALTLSQTLTTPAVAFSGTGANGVVNFLNAATTTAGALNVTGQTAGGTNAGGAINLTGGTASGAAAGGLITLQGGAASATSGSNGGGISILAANGTSTSTGGAGGNVQVTAGNGTSTGNNNGGNVTLTAGSAGSGGSAVIGSTLVKNAANGTTAFQVQNTSSAALLTVDTTSNWRVYVGPVAGDTVGALLVLGNKTNSGDPTGVEGAMYYNSNSHSFRCYQFDHWSDCMASARSGYHHIFELGAVVANESELILATNGTGSGSSPVDAVASHPSLFNMNVGTTTTGSAYLGSPGDDEILLGNTDYWRFETVLRPATAVSDGTNRYVIRAGFIEQPSGTDGADGCFFKYSDNVNSGKWQGTCLSNTSTTATCDTGIATAIGTWYRLTVVVNTAGTSVDFRINGVSKCTISTAAAIPTGASRVTGRGVSIQKSLGAADRDLDIDYEEIEGQFGTAR